MGSVLPEKPVRRKESQRRESKFLTSTTGRIMERLSAGSSFVQQPGAPATQGAPLQALPPDNPFHPRLSEACDRYDAAMAGLQQALSIRRDELDVDAVRKLNLAAREVMNSTEHLIRMCMEHGGRDLLSLCLRYAVHAQRLLVAAASMTRDSTSILRPDSLPPALRAVPMLIAARRDEVESETEATCLELLAELCAMRGKEECSQDDARFLAGAFKQCVLSLLVELDELKIPDGVKLELEGSAAVLLADLASQVGLQDDDAFNLPKGARPDAALRPCRR